jgi:mannose-6-phosphate isomerase-like protein (cupin superfamily)
VPSYDRRARRKLIAAGQIHCGLMPARIDSAPRRLATEEERQRIPCAITSGARWESATVAICVIRPDELEWTTRDHEPEEPPRHVAELSESAGFAHTRANVWRYEPGAKGRRHKHMLQEETFVVLAGMLSMYLGDSPERQDVPSGGLIHVEPGTPLQTANHGDEDLVLYAYGTPPEHEHAEVLDSAV